MTEGTRYGAYRLAGELDSGGMATVHVATHTRLGHVVAIKVLHPHYQKDEFLRSRFVDEARIQANLVHENVLTVRDILELPGTTAIVMDLLRGVTLKQYFKHVGLPLPTRRVLELFISITDGLDAAHASGIVHRDLKPSNIFLHCEGQRVVPKVMDFGVAKHQWMDLKEQNTATGTILGTPHYMAPEQYDDASTVDRQADIFSLGVMLFEATTGRVPFEGRRPASMMASVLTRPVPKPSGIQMDYPLRLEEVILRCLEKDPLDRYRNAAALRDALAEVGALEGREAIPDGDIPVPELEGIGIRLDRLQGVEVARAAEAAGGDPLWEGTIARPGREDDGKERVGSHLSGFQIQEVIQDSGTTVIYRGIGLDDGRPVLIKGHRKEIPNVDEIARIRHEFQILRNIDIEGAPRARDLVKHQNGFLLVLEDEGGLPLSRLLEEGPLDLRDVLAYGLRLAAVVTRLHARDVIHKQITPDNVFVNSGTGVVELVDFGLASRQPAQVVHPRAAAAIEEDLRYVSPEQTGRVNRDLDYRTDFYSLGATLYHALTGAPPFDSEDPEALVRMVISRRPEPLWAGAGEVPAVVSDIVERLLSKEPEARYQSGRGIQADLERCLRQLLTSGGVQPFQLGAQDVSERFIIPQKLYGRDLEVRTLLDAFERTRTGAVEMLLVAGRAGIGKTALVREIHRPVTESRGIFVEGKFDQYTRDVPYGAVIEGLHRVMRDILTRGEAEQEEWRTRILEAMGPNAAVIGDVAPELYHLIGPQPAPPELPPAGARNRFLLAVHNLVGVFARADHPTVFFLDDLQWADAASLRLLAHLVTARERRHLLVIGAYRDNEVDAAHPLRALLEEIEAAGQPPERITLGPLSTPAVTQLVAEAVDRTLQEVEPLAEVVTELSGSNPFFLGVCLRTFQREGWIAFQMRSGHWTWEIDAIRESSGDLYELLDRKVSALSEDAMGCLSAAACVGSQFDLMTLALALDRRPGEVLVLLKESVGEQLILGLGETYKYFDLEEQGPVEEVPEELFYGAVAFKFAHDRIQQAAYHMIPEEERAAVHWAIGHHILEAVSQDALPARIFAVVNQLNAGRSLAGDRATRLELAEFNLIAARRSKASTAYRTAFNYLRVALDLCDEETWRDRRALALDLHVEAAEAAYLSTEFVEMERYVDRVVEHATSLDETIRAYEVQMQGDIARARKREAIRTGLRVLALLGVRIPEAPSLLDVGRAFLANRLA
ncbi:MAG: AAA family ATPase, partial [Pseudomonadota bacterium]